MAVRAMTFMEIVVHAWTCDFCGLEALAGDDMMPFGWVAAPDGERHACPVCVPPESAAQLERILAS